MNGIAKEMIFKPALEYKNDEHAHGVFHEFRPGTVTLRKGQQIAEGFKPLQHDIVMLKDVAVKMRDGITIYTDIYLPAERGEKKFPTLIAWSPYGKSDGSADRYRNLFNLMGMGNHWNSGLTKFEGPDPDYWTAHGYAVCNPDPRGIAHSEGDITMIGSQEAEDGYDLIEWVARQEWSNGRTALTGTSYLAFSQWFIAATRPPHLTCINPNEGLSDAYRDMCRVGGIPDPHFLVRLQMNHCSARPGTRREDMIAEEEAYPLANAPLWKDKKADTAKINIPVYMVASYGNSLHTMGTFRSWRNLGTAEKWMRIHDTQEWPDYYSREATEDRLRFFDHYLKGIDNGWEKTPRVRYLLYDMEGGNRLNIPAKDFGYGPNIRYTKYYLDAATRTLSPQSAKANEAPAAARYEVGGIPGRISFMKTFDAETSFVGYPKLKVFAAVEGSDDMDLFVWVQKLDKFGNILSQINIPNHGAVIQDFTQDGASIIRYKGPNGKLRLSMRRLSQEATDEVPAYSFDRVEKLEEGHVYEADIVLSPIGLTFHKGETLRVVISPDEEVGAGMMPGTPGCIPNNKGTHIVYTGGRYASYLQLPEIHEGAGPETANQ